MADRWDPAQQRAREGAQAPSRDPSGQAACDASWLERFHGGARDVLEACYRDYFRVVDQAVGQVLRGADRESVVHEVFLQLLSRPELRRGFSGGGFAAWLTTIARHQAIDFWRRYRHERSLDPNAAELASPESQERQQRAERAVEAHLLVERFRRERLPAKWAPVFEARFVSGLGQRAAAARLGISRTTLAYQELQVRRLLKKFLLRKVRP
jgi:RNA polymerase sigma-70 factor (ECF subfamily)